MQLSCVVLVAVPLLVKGFPDGAPVDACVKPKPNRPYHGRHQPQPADNLPYSITASDDVYGPGSRITVSVKGDVFRGFFLQARDVATGAWVGTWEETPNTKGLPECAAVTHGDNRNKLQATVVWTAPEDTPGGRVYFTGSVVKDYETFWTDIVGQLDQ
ncbi:Putative defense protein 3 [Zootermopsis nevadensis]|uniref:Putative defense protein 3 n=1 Tax=Zootermopsis nevadensis TaxID=136037 RepID=A0A067QXU0_ZOONE|nr:Putative defense protein 3 [Zootermopsis nevadensis]